MDRPGFDAVVLVETAVVEAAAVLIRESSIVIEVSVFSSKIVEGTALPVAERLLISRLVLVTLHSLAIVSPPPVMLLVLVARIRLVVLESREELGLIGCVDLLLPSVRLCKWAFLICMSFLPA